MVQFAVESSDGGLWWGWSDGGAPQCVVGASVVIVNVWGGGVDERLPSSELASLVVMEQRLWMVIGGVYDKEFRSFLCVFCLGSIFTTGAPALLWWISIFKRKVKWYTGVTEELV